MEKLIKFLYGERSRVNNLLIYAIHSNYCSHYVLHKLIKFLYGERSRVNNLLIYAIHSDYNSYCTFARRAKITTHELYSNLQLAGIEISQVTNKNMYNEEFHKMVLRELFVQMKQDKVEILKSMKYDFSKNSKN